MIITSEQGANRVYAAGEIRFERRIDDEQVVDDAGRAWQVSEDGLVLVDDARVRLARVPAQRAFWFGWYAQFPDTALVD